ncbi:hypothetical protein [Alteraurantiacibacter palmitatis]|uniref:Uncharacterized protein n=1 Tax=Alteraurantiacibacter palmitatis TaxID=2054628 RepID=A0ABV7E7Q5_9SPHN
MGLIALGVVGHSVITGVARGRAILRELAALDAAPARQARPAKVVMRLRPAQPRLTLREAGSSRAAFAISRPVRAAA